jgi:hypothetical protein
MRSEHMPCMFNVPGISPKHGVFLLPQEISAVTTPHASRPDF